MKKSKEKIKAWLYENMHKSIWETLQKIRIRMTGHYKYYGINGNYKDIAKFYKYVKYTYYRILQRRGQKNPIK